LKKLDTDEYRTYWKSVHAGTPDDLAAVCFPGKSLYYNRFFDRTQIFALKSALEDVSLDLTKQTLLDVGCGRGRWLRFFQNKYGAVPSGIDLSEDAVRACVASGQDVRTASITEMPFANDSFDALTSITVLLHIPYNQKEKAISEIARVVKSGGYVILLENTWSRDPSPHVYGLSVDKWTELFQANGLLPPPSTSTGSVERFPQCAACSTILPLHSIILWNIS
jgi:SAM-dependent methyltransferase